MQQARIEQGRGILGLALFLVGLSLVVSIGEANAQAVRDHTAERYKKAEKLLAKSPAEAYELARQLPQFGKADDLRLELLAKSALRSGHPDVAKQSLQSLRRESPSKSIDFWAGLTLAELHLLGSDLDKTDELVDRLVDAADDLDVRVAEERFFRSRLIRLRHDLAVARDDREKARELALELKTEYPSSEAAKQSGLVETGPLEDKDRYVQAKSLYDAWSYHRARGIFETLKEHPSYGDTARWYLGHIALNKLRDAPKEAERLFDSLDEDSAYAAEALYNKARSKMTQEDYDAALEILDDYEDRYPGGRRTESVHYYRGWLPYDHRENKKAVEGFKAYIDRYGKRASRSSYIYGFLAWTYMRMEEWEKAIETYDEMETFGNMLVWGKALYWQAYAYRQLEKTDEAIDKLDELRDRYPVTYYGVLGEQLRARIRGRDPTASKVWWPTGGGSANDTPSLDVERLNYSGLSYSEVATWGRVKTLVALGEKERARETLKPIYDELRDSVGGSNRDEWVHAMGHYVGDYHRMWIRATGGSISAMPDPPEPTKLEAVMAYPQAYHDVVEDVAREFSIPTYLMWSIMRQESRYRPAQISHANAVGALQMIPKTARKVARDLGTTYNPRTFYKPEVGFRFSGFYMKKLLETFDGLFVPMAASYNSGPKVVAHWFEENPKASFPWLIEEFAYNEGRNYCRKVAEHMVRYLYLYEDDDERRKELLDRIFPTSRDIDIPEDVGY